MVLVFFLTYVWQDPELFSLFSNKLKLIWLDVYLELIDRQNLYGTPF